MDADKKFLTYLCDNQFRQFVYECIHDEIFGKDDLDTETYLTQIISNGILSSDLEPFNSAYKCTLIFDEYRCELAEEIYRYLSESSDDISHEFVKFMSEDPLCYTIKHKHNVVLFGVIIVVSEWLSCYRAEHDIDEINLKDILQ